VLNVLFLRPVGKAIRERREYIDSLTADYDRYQTEANAVCDQAEAVRAAGRREAEQIIAKARADASNDAGAILQEYATKSQAEIEAAAQTVEAEIEKARASEPQVVRELADLMLQRTLPEAAK
jgi:F-type H+-transporting ATPase subunit b